MATIEVILKQKLDNLGSEADVVKVRAGYARNYLLPKDLVAPATKASKKMIENLRRKRAEREAAEFNEAQEQATKLGKLLLDFTLTSGEGTDKVFGSVTAQDIANKLKDKGVEIDRRKIDLPKDIKGTGEHEVVVHLGHGVTAKLKVTVEHKSAGEDEAAKAEDAS